MSHFGRIIPLAICAFALGIAPAFASVDGNGATTPSGASGPTNPSVDPTSGNHPSETPDQGASGHKHSGQHHASPNQQNTSVTSGSPSSPNASDTSGPPSSGAITHSGG